MNTTKRERFERVASTRVRKILSLLDLLGNCSNKNNYDFSDKDVDLMFSEINRALKDTKNRFDFALNRKDSKDFKF
jgi:hypothetical protein